MWSSNLLPRAYDCIYDRILGTFGITVLSNHKLKENDITLYDLLQIQLILGKFAQPTLEFVCCFDESDNVLTFNLKLGDTKKIAHVISQRIPFFKDKEKQMKKILGNIKVDAVVQYFVEAFEETDYED